MTTKTIDELVCALVGGKKSLTFQSKETRKLVADRVRKLGYKVCNSSIRNQRLHPMYVDDWENDVDSGFGNVQYKTFFSVLYLLGIKPDSPLW